MEFPKCFQNNECGKRKPTLENNFGCSACARKGVECKEASLDNCFGCATCKKNDLTEVFSEADLDPATREAEIKKAMELPKCTSMSGCSGGASIDNCFGCPSCKSETNSEVDQDAAQRELEIKKAMELPRCVAMSGCSSGASIDNCFGCPDCKKYGYEPPALKGGFDPSTRDAELKAAIELPKCTKMSNCPGSANIGNCFGCPDCKRYGFNFPEVYNEEDKSCPAMSKEDELKKAMEIPKCFNGSGCSPAKATLENNFGCPACMKDAGSGCSPSKATIENCFGCPSCKTEVYNEEDKSCPAMSKEEELKKAMEIPKCFNGSGCSPAKATLENNFGCPACMKDAGSGCSPAKATIDNCFGCPTCDKKCDDDKSHKDAVDGAMAALNKVRANAQNLAMSTEMNCTPKHLSTAVTDKHFLKDFKHPKPTSAAQVISTDGTLFAQITRKDDDEDDDDEDDKKKDKKDAKKKSSKKDKKDDDSDSDDDSDDEKDSKKKDDKKKDDKKSDKKDDDKKSDKKDDDKKSDKKSVKKSDKDDDKDDDDKKSKKKKDDEEECDGCKECDAFIAKMDKELKQ